MRAVALGNEEVQQRVAKSFVPLKVAILPGTKEIDLDWPAMEKWRGVYKQMGGESCEGFTCCTVVTPDLEIELGNTGSAFVWEMFDSIAYDPEKFSKMLDDSLAHGEKRDAILADKTLSEAKRQTQLRDHERDIKVALAKAGRFRLPPLGFSVDGAVKLFEMTGDIPTKKE